MHAIEKPEAVRLENNAAPQVRLQYGFNETDTWRHFALGPGRERIWKRLRDVHTSIIRLFIFDGQTPDPITNWDLFSAYVQAVLNSGADPMITIAKFGQPYDDPQPLRRLCDACRQIVRRCIDEWGGGVVRDWYWCIGNEPNSEWSSAGLTFEQYRRIYQELAEAISDPLVSWLLNRKARIGGPAVDGFQPFWVDWIWRLLNDVDESLIGFVSWHRYGDWREHGKWGAPADATLFRNLLLSRTREYEVRARAVGRLLKGRNILNICGELNAHSHFEMQVSGPYNQSLFGAAYYGSALIHLMRGGADVELLSGGTAAGDPYGVFDEHGSPGPVYHAKQLCTNYIQTGDRLAFDHEPRHPALQILIAQSDRGRYNAFLVHLSDQSITYRPPQLPVIGSWRSVLKLDRSTDFPWLEIPFNGELTFHGYGVAVLTEHPVLDHARKGNRP